MKKGIIAIIAVIIISIIAMSKNGEVEAKKTVEKVNARHAILAQI